MNTPETLPGGYLVSAPEYQGHVSFAAAQAGVSPDLLSSAAIQRFGYGKPVSQAQLGDLAETLRDGIAGTDERVIAPVASSDGGNSLGAHVADWFRDPRRILVVAGGLVVVGLGLWMLGGKQPGTLKPLRVIERNIP